jgi:hypothetical protein
MFPTQQKASLRGKGLAGSISAQNPGTKRLGNSLVGTKRSNFIPALHKSSETPGRPGFVANEQVGQKKFSNGAIKPGSSKSKDKAPPKKPAKK